MLELAAERVGIDFLGWLLEKAGEEVPSEKINEVRSESSLSFFETDMGLGYDWLGGPIVRHVVY